MAEGIRFKTGYVGPAFDFAQAGRNISAQIEADVEKRREIERRNRLERDQQYGFSKAMQESVDGKLNQMFRGGAQLLLQDLQEKSSAALVSGDATDIAAYNAAKQEYMSFTNIATAKSAQNNQTRANIVAGSIQGMAGTQQEALASFMQYDKAEYTFDENGRLITYGKDGTPTYWAESNIADVNDLFIPPMMWEGTNYMPENVGKDIYDNLLSAQAESLQVRDSGFATGEINSDEAYGLINEELQSRLELRGPEFLEAMQAIAYKTLNAPGKTELTESDFSQARALYNEEQLFNTITTDGRNAASGKINDRGEWQFDVSDDELEADTLGDVARKRKAIKLYMEQSAQRAYNLIPVDNQQAQIEALRREEEEARLKAISDAEAAAAEAAADVQDYAQIVPFKEPARVVTDSGVQDGEALKVKASLSGRTFRFNMSGRLVESQLDAQGNTVSEDSKELLTGDVKVEVKNVIHDNRTGKIIGFDLNTGPGLIEGALLSIDGTPIKNVTVARGSDAFDEVYSSIMGIAAPSKTKRSGEQFLRDAEESVMYSLGIEPVSEASIERFNNYMAAIQSITINNGRSRAENVSDIVASLPLTERIEMETRIFEAVSKGKYPTVSDGEIQFPN